MADSIPTPSAAPPARKSSKSKRSSLNSPPVDVYATYQSVLKEDPLYPQALAAVSAIITAIETSPLNTVSETLSLISQLSNTLALSVKNPCPVTAGIDLLQRHLVTTLQRPGGLNVESSHPDADFATTKTAIVTAGKSFVAKGLAAKDSISQYGPRLIRNGAVVIVPHPSYLISELISKAAMEGVQFRVVVVEPTLKGDVSFIKLVAMLNATSVLYSLISSTGIAHTISELRPQHSSLMVLATAEAILSNGSLLGPLGTQQAGLLAKSLGNIPFYALAESFKCVKHFPLGPDTFGEQLKALSWENEMSTGVKHKAHMASQSNAPSSTEKGQDLVDVTSPDLVTGGILTECGVMRPAAISEEIVKIWF